MEKQKVDKTIVIAAITSLTAIELVAMATGHNGTLRMMIIALVCALAGIVMPTPDFILKKK